MKKENFYISAYPNKYQLNKMVKVPLEWYLTNNIFKDKVEKVRSYEYHSQEYNDAKEEVGTIATINGLVECGKPKTAENININPTICIDIDMQDNKEYFEKHSLDEIKYAIIDIPSCMYVCKSIGGYGLMVIHRLSDKVSKDNFIEYFNELQYIYAKNGITVDNACKNVNRLRYCTYDESVLKNEIYEPYELKGLCNKDNDSTSIDYLNISIDIISKDIDLDKSEGPFYFGHSDRHYGYPLISEVIHTLLCFYSKDEVKEIWKHPKFYKRDKVKWSVPYDILRWVDNFPIRDKMIPSNKVMKFLNDKCGFSLEANVIKESTKSLQNVTGDMINDFFHDKIEIELDDNEFLYDKKDIILSNFKEGINFLIAPTGVGKTEFWNKLYKDNKCSICVVEPYTSVVQNKYDESITYIAAGTGKYIDTSKDYVATNYLKFVRCVKQDKIPRYDFLVLDESHLIGTQSYRSDSLIEFINCVKDYNKKYPESNIILQTATPSNEDYFFDDIKSYVEVNKDTKKFVQIHYTYNLVKKNKKILEEYDDYVHDNIKTILYYINMYRREGRKVYVYWGSGGISNMKDIQKLEDMLANDSKCAVFHKKNDQDDSMKYIMEKHKMGKYDILISSCFFSVGCDLDDETHAAIIIVGNNPYQEDEQVIGRFRKSKNIKVNILVDNNCYIKKHDTSVDLELASMRGKRLNISKKSREKSMIRRYSEDESLEAKAFIECSNIYFSDYNRKFEWYSKRKYNVVNKIEIYKEDNNEYYDILDITKEGYLPTSYYIDYDDRDFKDIVKEKKNFIKDLKKEIYKELIDDNYYDVESLYESSKDKPRLLEWLKAINMIQKYYDIKTFIKEISTDSFMTLNKNKMNDLIRLTINIKNKEDDKLETELIKTLCSIYDNNKDNIEVYLIIFYAYWCQYYQEEHTSSYDMYDKNLSYPVYKEWKNRVISILEVNKEIRDYMFDSCKEKTLEIDDISYQFLKDIINVDKSEKEIIDYFKNKLIHQDQYKEFIKNQIEFISMRDKRKAGGKISKRGKEVIIDGITYETVKAAAEALNISRTALYKRMKKS